MKTTNLYVYGSVWLVIAFCSTIFAGCTRRDLVTEPPNESETTMGQDLIIGKASVIIVPAGVLCHHFRPINVSLLMNKGVFSQLSLQAIRIRLIDQEQGRVAREEEVILKGAECREAEGEVEVWLWDVLKAPSLSAHGNEANNAPLPTGRFYLEILRINNGEKTVVGKSQAIEIVKVFR